ncbi:MAG: adenylate/guanylate cyclase domain-containing protein [Acidimicrobiia bacterium]|nr:adenylate/guanylate cyclase domain-containing protein [Acidimicrobiia bacterium]
MAALTVTAGMIDRGVLSPEVALQVTRVIASSAARVAETQLEGLTPRAPTSPSDPERLAAETEALLATPRFFEHMWRRHLAALARRARLRLTPGEAAPVAVGFADLVGFTRMSATLDEEALATVVDRFALLAFDRVAAAGGRVVKMIGDEVMFSMDDLRGAAELGLDLVDAYAGDFELPDVRVSLTWGPVLARDGDLFGSVVNLASRIVGVARPASVVVSNEVHEQVEGEDGFGWHRMRPRYLKGIGRVPLWVLRRADN